ncbi:MAG: tripartite tricarboxylate transporter TctB family protein [Syntrophales bacterium]|nr:tripartite tricarboxylate transporter TctB family protein [Syntrophales bacterium]
MNWSNIIIGIILLISSVFYYFSTSDFPPATKTENLGPGFFPTILAVVLAFLAILLVLNSLLARGASGKEKDGAVIQGAERLEEDSFGAEQISYKFLFGTIGLSFLYVGLLSVLGYLISTPLFLIILIRLLGYEKWGNNVAASIGLTATLYLLFAIALGVNLPAGLFFS